MTIEQFTEKDIKEAALLAYPTWGEGHAANGQGRDFGLLMCEYIVRYGWYGEDYAWKIVEEGRMTGCILAGKITQSNNYNEWLATKLPAMNDKQKNEALMLQSYFINTSPKVYRHMNPTEDLYLSFYVSTIPGCGKRLLAEVITKARREGFKNLYLWTDSSCNHCYYAHNGFTLVEEFKNGDWDADDDSYLTYIYKKSF